MKDDWSILYVAEHANEIWDSIHWPEGPTCPKCKCHDYYKCSDGRYKCKHCGAVYSNRTDTLFHGTKIPLSYWMVTLYLMLSGKGISSCELARKLTIHQPTAYYMLTRLRCAMGQENTILDGPTIAMDELYIGGTWSRFTLSKKQALLKKFCLPKHPKSIKEKLAIANAANSCYKQPVYGLNDGKKIVLQVMPNPIKDEDVIDVFTKHTRGKGVAVSDCSRLYDLWKLHTGFDIEYNNHSKGQYTTENGYSSNRIEGTFSWISRDFLCDYVHISKKWLQLYLDEFCYRWNCRELSMKDRMIQAITGCSQKYNKSVLDEYNDWEAKLIRPRNYNEPREIFERLGCLAAEIKYGGLIYRAEDFK